MRNFLFLIVLFVIFSCCIKAVAQNQSPIKQLPSPLAMVTYKYGDTYIKITYCRPSKKNRVIFGELVPFGKVWRTGANEATEITLTQDAKLAGKDIKAGTYSLFTMPEKDQWTIILNNELGQWGAFKYNEAFDYIRFQVPSSIMDSMYEVFTIEFETIDPKLGKANILIKWDKTKIVIPLELTADAKAK